jgi:multiple sugar transport system substrate-binding protein
MHRVGTLRMPRPYVKIASLISTALLAASMLPASSLAADKTIVTVAYSPTYVFDTNDLAAKWWASVKKQFDTQYPNAEMKLVPIEGNYDDIVNKLSLLYRSPATTPDVVQIPTPVVAQWVASNYLLPLDSYVANTDWYKDFPQVIRDEGTFDGKVYAVSSGENDSMLYYNKDMFAKAGLPVPWNPQNWDDILTAARQIHAKIPDVVPMWLMAGTTAGSVGIEMGAGNLLFGSSDPTVYDAATQKWVVDSVGLRETLGFYHSIYSEGLGAKLSDLFSPTPHTVPVTDLIPNQKVAIVLGSNFYGGQWGKVVCAPCWDKATEVEGVAPIPYVKGQAPNITTTVAGWDYAVAAVTPHPKEAFDAVNVLSNRRNSIDMANWSGFVPGSSKFANDPEVIDFGPPVNELASKIIQYGRILPPLPDFEVWSKGLQQATGTMAQHPETSVDDAIAILKDYLTNQLGEVKVETK